MAATTQRPYGFDNRQVRHIYKLQTRPRQKHTRQHTHLAGCLRALSSTQPAQRHFADVHHIVCLSSLSSRRRTTTSTSSLPRKSSTKSSASEHMNLQRASCYPAAGVSRAMNTGGRQTCASRTAFPVLRERHLFDWSLCCTVAVDVNAWTVPATV